jgi:hypothetical protein
MLGPASITRPTAILDRDLWIPAGEAEWQKGEEPWRREPPGAVIRHESMMPHATRTLAEPLLAAYLWRGDLATHARIIASPADSTPASPGL